MNTDQSTTTAKGAADVDARLKELMDKAEEINARIAETNRESRENMEAIEAEVDASIASVEKTFAELDEIEKEAGDELDTHLLQQAEDLARE